MMSSKEKASLSQQLGSDGIQSVTPIQCPGRGLGFELAWAVCVSLMNGTESGALESVLSVLINLSRCPFRASTPPNQQILQSPHCWRASSTLPYARVWLDGQAYWMPIGACIAGGVPISRLQGS